MIHAELLATSPWGDFVLLTFLLAGMGGVALGGVAGLILAGVAVGGSLRLGMIAERYQQPCDGDN